MLFNVFSDPKLRARQDQLNAQWIALFGAQQKCDGLPDTAWLEFVNDKKAWDEFYDSGSDWSSDSFNATNLWQDKLREWTQRFPEYGCVGSVGSVGGEDIPTDAQDEGIPGVKNPPADEKSLAEKAADAAAHVADPFKEVWSSLRTVGWVVVGLVVFLVVGLIYALTHVKASTPYGSVGT